MNRFQACLHLIIFLSLTATSPTLAKLAKTNCIDKCGNVMIPYPFGIGEGCAINQWYMVDCNNATPYLSTLNYHLEILSVSLENQTVTVGTPRIPDCQNPVQNSSQPSINLDGSPFVFSKRHNKFVFEGCGIASMTDKGSVVTTCYSACRDATLGGRNDCFGNGCCQTKIPGNLKSYIINLIGLEREREDGACASAFLVDEALYDQRRFSDPFIFKNTSFISLLWTLSDSNQITCCDKQSPEKYQLQMFDSTPLDTRTCSFYLPLGRLNNPYLIDGCKDYGNPKYAKPGCNDTCGNIRIPYPFGIGANCSVNKWYNIDCNSSKPYLSALNYHPEVLGVGLLNRTIRVNMPRVTAGCQNPVRSSSQMVNFDLGQSPFLFTNRYNKFVFEGCGIATMNDNGSVVTGCSTVCSSHVTAKDGNNCSGIGCCQTDIPNYLKSYSVNLTSPTWKCKMRMEVVGLPSW